MPPRILSKSDDISYAYRIIIEGTLDPALLPYLNDWDISYNKKNGKVDPEDENRISIMTGPIPDQVALSGLLDVLIDHRYILLSVNRIPFNSINNKNNN
ncbi:hypothetical protein LCM02_15665 [Lutimonas saemankumensis]|uniref:hypothetical protein n=1 Tax=Lutimonas saemankumensis TaxID=483016 RepID=UPI001CD3FB49|nr:hypothetical protein [Lutimonas saemankumensis]MCA0933899.1 hypothetical protein [Lutimonas saemankumensis]